MIGKIKNPAVRRAVIILTFPIWPLLYGGAGVVDGLCCGLQGFVEDLRGAW